MALVYSATGSLDGFIADRDGDFQFAAPDAELHAFVNDIFAAASTILMGRRTYDLMDYWDTLDLEDPEHDPVEIEFARHWRETDKVVYSRTLTAVHHPRTRLEATFEPDAVRTLLAATDGDALIGGAELAGVAFGAGLIDEVWTFLVPTVIGGGTPMFADGVRVGLELLEQHRFGSGAVGMHYRVTHRDTEETP